MPYFKKEKRAKQTWLQQQNKAWSKRLRQGQKGELK
jgi:hypothetical protein